MTRLFQHPWGWTSVAPILCAVHCVLAPVLAVAAPAFATSEPAEWLLLGLTGALATVAFGAGIRVHGALGPLVVAVLGLGFWTASLGGLLQPIPVDAVTVPAALLVAGGLLVNSRLHCAARREPCTACHEEAQEEVETARIPERPDAAASGVR